MGFIGCGMEHYMTEQFWVLYSAQFFPQCGIHTIRKSAAFMLPGISKPEIPGKEFIFFASEGMLQDNIDRSHPPV